MEKKVKDDDIGSDHASNHCNSSDGEYAEKFDEATRKELQEMKVLL